MEMRLLLADEADLVLIGAQTILKDRPDWDVMQTARSADELLEAACRCQPDIILFNEHLDPLIDVLALVERLKNIAPNSHQIVLGSQVDGLLVRDLFACGVLGYLFSGDDLGDCLIPALTTVMPVTRWAEAQTIIAEARVAANDLIGAAAAINAVRATRPGPPVDVPATTAAGVLADINGFPLPTVSDPMHGTI